MRYVLFAMCFILTYMAIKTYLFDRKIQKNFKHYLDLEIEQLEKELKKELEKEHENHE